MVKFLDCLVDNDLQQLVLAGRPSQDEIEEQWILLLAEFHELRGDISEGSLGWKLARDVQHLQNHLQLVQTCIDFLAERYTDTIAKCLRDLGYSFKPKSQDPAEYMELLVKVATKAKTRYIELQQMAQMVKREIAKIPEEKVVLDKNVFYELLINMELAFKVPYNMETITVGKFLGLEKRYLEIVAKSRMPTK